GAPAVADALRGLVPGAGARAPAGRAAAGVPDRLLRRRREAGPRRPAERERALLVAFGVLSRIGASGRRAERPEGAQEAAPAARQSERLLPAPRSAGPVGGGDGPAQELAADAVAGMDGLDPVLLYQEVRATGADAGTQGGMVCRRTRESLPFHRR